MGQSFQVFVFLLANYLCVCVFLGLALRHMEVPRWGSNGSCSCPPQPQPQPQRCRIQAISATYTTDHHNAGSLTYGVRPGIEPVFSWILVGVVTAEPQQKLPFSQLSCFISHTLRDPVPSLVCVNIFWPSWIPEQG